MFIFIQKNVFRSFLHMKTSSTPANQVTHLGSAAGKVSLFNYMQGTWCIYATFASLYINVVFSRFVHGLFSLYHDLRLSNWAALLKFTGNSCSSSWPNVRYLHFGNYNLLLSSFPGASLDH